MSSRQLEEMAEHGPAAWLADGRGLTLEEVELLEGDLGEHRSDDGVLYGYNVYFREGSDSQVLAKIPGLVNGNWIRIGPNFE